MISLESVVAMNNSDYYPYISLLENCVQKIRMRSTKVLVNGQWNKAPAIKAAWSPAHSSLDDRTGNVWICPIFCGDDLRVKSKQLPIE